jgi:hypothetical protein
MLMRLSVLFCGFGAVLLLAATIGMSSPVSDQSGKPTASPSPEAPPEVVAVYIRSCVTAIYELMRRLDKKDLPKSCEDPRVQVTKPDDVTRSRVWVWRDSVSIDATLADQRRVLFDADRMMLLPRYPPGDPNHRPVQGCTTYGGFGGGSMCCTINGFCCTWIYEKLGSCGYPQ